MPRKFNADAFEDLARYATTVLRVRGEIAQQVTATQEAISQSRALMAEADAILPDWLWPAYR